ncbi:MAG: Asp-tRNA(Asn)/Glu-tRNA(Gln) amidotransferase subunit GatB, partial [Patescibacteria group bacterium]|nr:Asp-tRNA(Asn)/Glu-tRNA(Gln) amidotransferase subunit GatB [Patescibacteria group bacterium]
QAGDFARELQLILRTLGAGEANMEKGQMRIEANISVSRDDTLGTKVEVKNLNSFRSVERAIAYELERQSALLEKGGVVEQETRGWDESTQKTFSQRKKESSHDYRYFPDPDLPSLTLSEVMEFKDVELPELPWERRARYSALGLQEQDVKQLVGDPVLSVFFETVVARIQKPDLVRSAANYTLNFVAGVRKDKPEWLPNVENFITVIEANLPSPQARSSILAGVITQGIGADELAAIVEKIVNGNPKVVVEYKAGKETALQFLIGQGMRESKGSANPEALRSALIQALA